MVCRVCFWKCTGTRECERGGILGKRERREKKCIYNKKERKKDIKRKNGILNLGR